MIHRHIRKHKKNYVRFLSFFAFLVVYSVLEDLVSVAIHGVELDIVAVINIIAIAVGFTLISEVTERLFKKEEPKLERMIKKEEILLESKGRKLESKLIRNNR